MLFIEIFFIVISTVHNHRRVFIIIKPANGYVYCCDNIWTELWIIMMHDNGEVDEDQVNLE